LKGFSYLKEPLEKKFIPFFLKISYETMEIISAEMTKRLNFPEKNLMPSYLNLSCACSPIANQIKLTMFQSDNSRISKPGRGVAKMD